MSKQSDQYDATRDHALILSAWLCIIGDAQISYLSGPITTGTRWVEAVERVNGGRILGQRGGVKAGHFRRGTVVCKKAPDRGPFCKSASALGIRLG